MATQISLAGVPAKQQAPGEPLTTDQRMAIADRDQVYNRLDQVRVEIAPTGAKLDDLNQRIFNPQNPIVSPPSVTIPSSGTNQPPVGQPAKKPNKPYPLPIGSDEFDED